MYQLQYERSYLDDFLRIVRRSEHYRDPDIYPFDTEFSYDNEGHWIAQYLDMDISIAGTPEGYASELLDLARQMIQDFESWTLPALRCLQSHPKTGAFSRSITLDEMDIFDISLSGDGASGIHGAIHVSEPEEGYLTLKAMFEYSSEEFIFTGATTDY